MWLFEKWNSYFDLNMNICRKLILDIFILKLYYNLRYPNKFGTLKKELDMKTNFKKFNLCIDQGSLYSEISSS